MAGYGKQVGKLSLRVLPDASKFRRDIDVLIERIERTKQIKLQVLAETAQARRELERFHEKWNGEDIRMGLEVGTARAREQLAVLTRRREVTIAAKTDKMSFAKVAAGINSLTARLTGLRVAKDVFSEFREQIVNLDKSTGKISRVSLALANLGSVLTNSIGGIVTASSDILNVANLGFVLPAAFAGAATGAVALVLALQDMSTVLGDLGPAFSAIKPLVSEGFWSQAEGPIRDLATTYLPALTDGMTRVGTAIGYQFGAIANAFNTSLGGGVFESFFDTLVQTIDIASNAVTPLIQAFVKIGEVGSAYLPDFASWMVQVSASFNDWVQNAAATGQMANLIEAGVRATQDLGNAAGGIVGIFYAINTAASAAGGGGLHEFAVAMQAASDILNSPEVQTALTSIFIGAGDGLSQIGVGLANFGQTLVALAPTISGILGTAGEALGTLITGISIALNQPEVKDGFTALFDGILVGVQGIVPALPVLFGLFGQLAGIVGALAAQFGPLLGVLKETFAPVLEAVLGILEPLIPMLGGMLVGAIGALAGPMQGLADFINQNQEGLTKLAAAAIVIAPAIMVGVKAFQAFRTVMAVVKGVQAGFVAASYGMQAASYATGAAAKVGAVGFKMWGAAVKAWGLITKGAAAAQALLNAAWLANPIGVIIVAITAVVAALVWFFTQTKLGKQIWSNFVQFLSEAWDNIVAGWNGIVDGFSQGWAQIQAFFQGVIDWVLSLFGIHSPSRVFMEIGQFIVEGFVQGFQNLISAVGAVWDALLGWFQGFWSGLMSFFGTWGTTILAIIAPFIGIPLLIIQNWDTIVATLGAIWQGIVDLATTVFGAIGEFFTNLWTGIVTFATTVWQNYVLALQLIWQTIIDVATTVFGAIGEFFAGVWNGVVSFATTVWTTYVAGLTLIWQTIVTVATTVFTALVTFFSGIWTAISSAASAVWNGIVAFVGAAIRGVQSVVTSVLNGIKSFWQSTWNAISSAANAVWSAIKSFVSSAINGVQSTISNVLGTIKGIWKAGWDALKAAVDQVWQGIKSAVQGAVDAVKTTVSQIVDTVKGIKDKVVGAISGAGSWLLESGKKIVQGLIDGITSMIGNAGDAIGSVMSKVRNFLPFSPAKEGPFSGKGWTPYSGKALVDGLADGMRSRISNVASAARAMTDAASATATVGLETTGDSLDSAYAARVAAGVPDYITINGGVGYDPASIAREIAFKKKQAALAAGLGMVPVR